MRSHAKKLPERVLVTGAAGFIGSHLVDRLLAEGCVVWGIDNFDSFYPRSVKESNLEEAQRSLRFRLVEGDIRDEAFLAEVFGEGQFQAVAHLAARPGVRPSIEAPDDCFDCNVMGTVRLVETMRRFGVNVLAFASSSSVYGAREGREPFSEDDVVDGPVSPYAASKRAGELVCHTYWHLHGLRCYSLRFFTVYGPRQRPDLAIHKFTRAIQSARPIQLYGDGSMSRDYTYVDDVVEAVWRTLGRGLSGDGSGYEILNIGASRPVPLNELVRLLAEAINAEPIVERLPAQPGDVPRTSADIARAREVLGYEPKTPIEEGLRRFVAWYLAQHEVSLTASAKLGTG